MYRACVLFLGGGVIFISRCVGVYVRACRRRTRSFRLLGELRTVLPCRSSALSSDVGRKLPPFV